MGSAEQARYRMRYETPYGDPILTEHFTCIESAQERTEALALYAEVWGETFYIDDTRSPGCHTIASLDTPNRFLDWYRYPAGTSTDLLPDAWPYSEMLAPPDVEAPNGN